MAVPVVLLVRRPVLVANARAVLWGCCSGCCWCGEGCGVWWTLNAALLERRVAKDSGFDHSRSFLWSRHWSDCSRSFFCSGWWCKGYELPRPSGQRYPGFRCRRGLVDFIVTAGGCYRTLIQEAVNTSLQLLKGGLL